MSAKFFSLEKKLSSQLAKLKKEFGLFAVKAEFEAEGSSFRDLLWLRRLTAKENIPLFLKIGGVEALRDIKDALDLGVDGLISPMVESPFGVVKFIGAIESVYGRQKIFKSINIESCEAVRQVDEILKVARGKIDNVTIGRTDLSQSYFNSKIEPDSSFILELIEELSYKIISNSLGLTLGGSVTSQSIRLFTKYHKMIKARVSSIETRKIVLASEKMLSKKNTLKEALRFEEYYLNFKLEREAWLSKPERERLAKLKERL